MRILLLTLVSLSLGCAGLEVISKTEAERMGTPECFKMFRHDCEELVHARQIEQDRKILLAGIAVCHKLSLPDRCVTLISPQTLFETHGESLTDEEKIQFEMAHNLVLQVASQKEQEANRKAAYSAAVTGAVLSRPAPQVQAPTTTTCMKFGRQVSCNSY